MNHLLGRSVVKDGSQSDSDSDDDAEDDDKLPPLSFEFVVAGTNNRLLRKGVEKEARQFGVSLEEAISITYFPASNAPEMSDEEEKLPDWVSCLSYNQSVLCSGCYDGSIHLYKDLYKDDVKKLGFVAVSSGPIKCLKSMEIDDKLFIASASLDHTLNLHTFDDDNQNMSCAMASLDFSSAQSKLLASGDGNGSIVIWDVTKTEESSEPKKKRNLQLFRIVHSDLRTRLKYQVCIGASQMPIIWRPQAMMELSKRGIFVLPIPCIPFGHFLKRKRLCV